MSTRRGFAARARNVHRTNSGTITVRDQYDTLLMWKGNHFGSSMISTGMKGTPRQGIWPNSASVMCVKTLAWAAPPRASTASRALTMWGSSGSSPVSLSA